jgi:hypothetical protein
MAEVALDEADVDPGVEQRGGVGMATLIVTLLILRRYFRSVIRIIPSLARPSRLSAGYVVTPQTVS